MKGGGKKGSKKQKTSYQKAIETQAKTNTRQAKVSETQNKISNIQSKKKKVETQIEALTSKLNNTNYSSKKAKKIQKKIIKKKKKQTKLEQKEAKKEAKLEKRKNKLINTQAKLNNRKELAGIKITNKSVEGIKQQEDFAKAITAFKTKVETIQIKNTQRKLNRKQKQFKAKEKRLEKLTKTTQKKLQKQAAKENRKKSGTLGFFEKHFNFTKKVSESNVYKAQTNQNLSKSNVNYYKTKVETLQLKKAKKEARENNTKTITITSLNELKTENGKIKTPMIKSISSDILANIKENEKYLGIDVDTITGMSKDKFLNKEMFISNIAILKATYQEQYSNLMKTKDKLNPDEKTTLLKLIEINREYGLNFSKNNSTTTTRYLNATTNNTST